MDTVKISQHIMEAIIEKPAELVTSRYERGFIEKQIVSIQKQKDDYIAARDAELAECAALLVEMDKLGITPSPDTAVLPVQQITGGK